MMENGLSELAAGSRIVVSYAAGKGSDSNGDMFHTVGYGLWFHVACGMGLRGNLAILSLKPMLYSLKQNCTKFPR